MMYSRPEVLQAHLDLEKQRADIERERAETIATSAETEITAKKAINDMALSGAKSDDQARIKISGMAQSEMRRRKK